jgi:hypothetical protein
MPSTPRSPKAFPAALGPVASPGALWRKVFKAAELDVENADGEPALPCVVAAGLD